jgi:hypothetical protein
MILISICQLLDKLNSLQDLSYLLHQMISAVKLNLRPISSKATYKWVPIQTPS